MHGAKYEILSDDSSFYGHISGFEGVWANAVTLEECRDELEDVLGEWILLRVADELELPVVEELDINVRKAAQGEPKMPAFGPVSRRDLIKALKKAGFEGPFAGGNHSFMARGSLRVPNPHGSDIGRELLGRILGQVGMTREEWEAL